MSSKTSLGMGSGLESVDSSLESGILTAEGGVPPGDLLYDTIAYLIYCSEHKKVALTRAMKDGRIRCVWFPFVALSSIGSWKDKSEEGIQIILRKEDPELEGRLGVQLRVAVSEPKRIFIQRIQVPVIRKFVTRLMYFVKIDNNSEYKCCENTKTIQWYPLSKDLKPTIKELWAPEVIEFTQMVESPKNKGINEYTLRKAYKLTEGANSDNCPGNCIQRIGL